MGSRRVYQIGDEIGKSQAIYLREAGKTQGSHPLRFVEYQCKVIGCNNTDIGRESALYGGYIQGTCKIHKGLHRHYRRGDKVGQNGAIYIQDIKMCDGIRYIECQCANPECNNTFIAPESKIYNGDYKGYCEKCKFVFSGLHGRKKRIPNKPICNEIDAPIFLEYIRQNHKLYGKFLCGYCKQETFVRDLDLVEGKRKQWYCNVCRHICSKGELKIKQILTSLHIKYKQQHFFNDCRGEKGQYLKFDFYLPDYNCCIEFDGEQHYNYKGAFGMSYEEFLKGQERDKKKNEYCHNHHIKLLRIPYTILDNNALDEVFILNSII